MLLYADARLMPVVFATAVAVTSKALFRVHIQNASRHFFNPSNFGITVTSLVFPCVGIVPPYHFTENLSGWGSWILPAVILASGSLLIHMLHHADVRSAGAWISGPDHFWRYALGRAFRAHCCRCRSELCALYLLHGHRSVTWSPIRQRHPECRAGNCIRASVAGVYSIALALAQMDRMRVRRLPRKANLSYIFPILCKSCEEKACRINNLGLVAGGGFELQPRIDSA